MRPARVALHSGAAAPAGQPARDPLRAQSSAVGNQALQHHMRRGAGASFVVAGKGDASEREASQAAASFVVGPGRQAPSMRAAGVSQQNGPTALTDALSGAGAPLADGLRDQMEAHFGVPLRDVRVHTGSGADRLAASLGAQAFAHGRDIVFGEGRRAGADALTAHEMAHVVQQTGGPGLTKRSEPRLIQPSFAASYVVPSGVFEVDLQTVDGGSATPQTDSGLDGTIRFVPARDAPNSNVIAFHQIARVVDDAGADLDPSSMATQQAPRGRLGDPGLRTQADPLRGVEAGFFTDVHHQPATPPSGAVPPAAAPGSALSYRYQWGAGRRNQIPGFKRSNDPADIRSALMGDFPSGTGVDAEFSLESVARGEDTTITYGSVSWGFGLRAGHVVNEHLRVDPGASATFDEALERHRDFYVHEPVTFYFDFDSAILGPAEAAKIDTFTAYLTRNPDIHMNVEGSADIVGGDSAYNRNLAIRRAEAVRTALIARGVTEEAIGGAPPTTAHLSAVASVDANSTQATTDAGTGDQGGDAALGADQKREANRWANRRVVLTFRRSTAAAP
jgi:outer membrane protein OmpA-like peptidoglycan-associated protein